jgi:hypothetical protein
VRLAMGLLFLLGMQGCATKLSESIPLAILLPDGSVLKGGIALRLGKGYFQASNGRLTCSGGATRSPTGLTISGPCSGANAPVKRIEGSAGDADGGSGQGAVTLDGRGSAWFLFGTHAEAIAAAPRP